MLLYNVLNFWSPEWNMYKVPIICVMVWKYLPAYLGWEFNPPFSTVEMWGLLGVIR